VARPRLLVDGCRGAEGTGDVDGRGLARVDDHAVGTEVHGIGIHAAHSTPAAGHPSTVRTACDDAHVPVDFTAIDFETANSSGASACSVGLVKVRDGRVVDRVHWYIRPPF